MALVKKSFSGAMSFPAGGRSTIGKIIRDGVVYEVAPGEPAISDDGIATFDDVTNELIHSEDFSQWVDATDDSVITINAIASPDKSVTADLLDDNDVTKILFTSQGVTLTDDFYTYSIFLKKGTAAVSSVSYSTPSIASTSVELTWATMTLSGGSASDTTMTELENGWVRLSIIMPSSAGAGTGFFRVVPAGGTSPVSTTGSVYAWGGMLHKGGFHAPYVKTSATATTRDSEGIFALGTKLLPAQDKPFTILIDAAIPEQTGSEQPPAFGFNTGAYLRREDASDVYFNLPDASGSIEAKATVDGGKHRYVCRYDGSERALFVDGVKGHTSPTGGTSTHLGTALRLGWDLPSDYLNSHIKNFKIWHKALSDEEISELGLHP